MESRLALQLEGRNLVIGAEMPNVLDRAHNDQYRMGRDDDGALPE